MNLNLKGKIIKKQFSLQWNITSKCTNRCKHCYLPNSKEAVNQELSFSDCIKVIDDFYETTTDWGIGSRLQFTGGDPLLKPEIFDLIKYAVNKKITVGLLGNPEYLTLQTANKLKRLGLSFYQLSLDGLEKTHDYLRSKGSFKRTLKAIKILNKANIPLYVMFTLSKINANELIPVIRLAAKENVSIFNFSRLVPTGWGKQLANQSLNSQEFRTLLTKVSEECSRLNKEGYNTMFGQRERLWGLLYKEMDLLPPLSKDKKTIFAGCPIGISILSILADGTVYACSRLPIKIGKVPKQSIKDIFINSVELNKMRSIEKMVKCGKCNMLQYCRGCPAIAYAAHGSYYEPDPGCWKK